MWKCHKCGKPVYFAERKQSLGYDWHPECLRCEECGKRLNPGQHAEHKGVPYCHVPCYGALFGPQLFGHGTRVESHKNFGVRGGQQAIRLSGPVLPRNHLESKLKVYNQFYDNKSMEIRSREVNNRLILEGALRVYWGVQGVIHLKEDDDQRTFVVRKRNSCRLSKAEKDNLSDKENEEASVSFEGNTTTSDQVENLSTDVSLSESISFDSCSLNEYTELPTTPEDASANISTNAPSNESNIGREKVENSASDDFQNSNTTSCLLPSNLCDVDKLKYPGNDTLNQYKLNHTTSASMNESLSLTACSSSNIASNHLVADARNNDDILLSPTSSSSNSTSSDNFLTATASMATTTSETNTDSITTASLVTVDNYETDEATLKPMDFEEFKRSVHQDYVNGANSFQTAHQDSLKRNQPIDPSRINDSLKLYNASENPMSKSFNCLTEHPLRSVDVAHINDTPSLKVERSSKRRIPFNLQKSDSGQTSSAANGRHAVNAINRSKSGPSCIDFSDSDTENEATLKPPLADSGDHISATIRKSNIPPRYIQIQMNCYTKEDNDDGRSHQDNLQSATTNSSCAAGDELTQTEEMYTVTDNTLQKDEQPLHITEEGVVLRKPPRTGATAIKRRSGNRRSRTKLKRRCSINGHFYNRETSFFTPPYGSQMSVWVTSLVTTQEVINLLLEKYKVDSMAENFSLFIIRDNGEQKRLKDSEYPLITRIMLGPHEDVAKLFLVDGRRTDEISNEVAQFINLSLPECRAILERYDQEMERETMKIKEKFAELKRRIVSRMESLKVHL